MSHSNLEYLACCRCRRNCHRNRPVPWDGDVYRLPGSGVRWHREIKRTRARGRRMRHDNFKHSTRKHARRNSYVHSSSAGHLDRQHAAWPGVRRALHSHSSATARSCRWCSGATHRCRRRGGPFRRCCRCFCFPLFHLSRRFTQAR